MMSPVSSSPTWLLLLHGEKVALLTHPRREDMFWWSYEVSATPGAIADVYSPTFWEQVFEVEDARTAARIPGVFAGKVRPRAPGERVWLRGFIPYPPSP